MARIEWSVKSLIELDSICEFIARDAPRMAQIFAEKVFQSVERLDLFPQSGRIVPELNNPKIREIIFGNYRIVYLHNDDLLSIITIYHSARLLSGSMLEHGSS